MAGKKKSGKQDQTLAAIVLITAILNLVKSLIDRVRAGRGNPPTYRILKMPAVVNRCF